MWEIKEAENIQKERWTNFNIGQYNDWRSERRTQFFDDLYIKNLYGKCFLEIGCGAGHLLEKLREKNPDADFFGIDISADMVKHCIERGFDNVIVGSGNDLPYQDEMFDVVFAGTWVMRYLNRDKALNEMHRVLKPHGLIAFDLPFLWGHGFCTLLRNKFSLPENAYLKLDGRYYPNWKHHLRKNGFAIIDVVGGIDMPVMSHKYRFNKPARSFFGLMCSSILWFLARKIT